MALFCCDVARPCERQIEVEVVWQVTEFRYEDIHLEREDDSGFHVFILQFLIKV